MSTPDDIQRLCDTVDALSERVDARLADDPVRESAFEKLYAELKDYKEGFIEQQERPLLLDLLLLYDSMSWFQQALVKDDMSAETIGDSFQFLVDELLEVLYRRDVVPMEATEDFDATVHKAVQLQKASTPDEDNRIATVLKRGFRLRDKPLRPEEVVVLKYRSGPGGS